MFVINLLCAIVSAATAYWSYTWPATYKFRKLSIWLNGGSAVFNLVLFAISLGRYIAN